MQDGDKHPRYKFEIWMRWGFLAALIALMGFSFFGSPFYRMMPALLGGTQTPRPQCQVLISRDFEHTAALGIPVLESLASKVRRLSGADGIAQAACRRDPSLKVVYLRETCAPGGSGQLSKTVFCK